MTELKGPRSVRVEGQAAPLGDFDLLWSQLSTLGQSLRMKLNFMKGLSLQNFFHSFFLQCFIGYWLSARPWRCCDEQGRRWPHPPKHWKVIIRASTSRFHSARHCSKGSSHVNSFSPPNKPYGIGAIIIPFYRWANWGTEWISTLPKVSPLVGCRARIWTQAIWFWASLPLTTVLHQPHRVYDLERQDGQEQVNTIIPESDKNIKSGGGV